MCFQDLLRSDFHKRFMVFAMVYSFFWNCFADSVSVEVRSLNQSNLGHLHVKSKLQGSVSRRLHQSV